MTRTLLEIYFAYNIASALYYWANEGKYYDATLKASRDHQKRVNRLFFIIHLTLALPLDLIDKTIYCLKWIYFLIKHLITKKP